MLLHDVRDDRDTSSDDAAIAVRADPMGLAVDRVTGTLFVADGTTGAILGIADGHHRRVATVGRIGPCGPAPLVGGIAITPFGTLFATQVGARVDGSAEGAIVRFRPDGSAEVFDRLERGAWRLGLTYDLHRHVLYATQFHASRFGAHDGSVIVIDLVTGEPSTVIDGFAKPIGIAKLGDTLVVADARQRAVYRVDLRVGRAVQRLQLVGDLGRPDSVCTCGTDSVLVTSFDPDVGRGAVRRLWLDGRTQGIGSGTWDPAGVATDGDRVFVAARRSSRVLVFPLG